MPVLGPGVADYTPSPDEVHALIPKRPVFTGTSKPTEAEVTGQINSAVMSLRAEFGDTLNARYVGKARFAATLFAASLVESAYFPEQQHGEFAPAQMLWTRYQGELLGLRALLGDLEGTGPGSKVGSLRLSPGLAGDLRPRTHIPRSERPGGSWWWR